MADILTWPAGLLTPQSSPFDVVPFSRSDGFSLGGLGRAQRTDRGWWAGSYNTIVFRRTNFDQELAWGALQVALGGKPGLIAVPVCSTAQWAGLGLTFGQTVPHDDDAPFDDGSEYSQDAVDLQMATYAGIGATVVTLRLVDLPLRGGIRFSYQHAMYKTGRILERPSADTYRVEIFPAIRAPIPAGSLLETEKPTVLCHLASDTEMNLDMTVKRTPRPTVNFVEAVGYWNDRALGLVD